MRLGRSAQDHLLRTLLGIMLVLIGFGIIGPLTNSPGLIILGSFLIVGVFITINRTLLFIFGLLLLALFFDVRLGALLFPYALYRITGWIWGRGNSKKNTTSSVPFVPSATSVPSDYHSYLENREHLERDATRSPSVMLVGQEGSWGTRWHYGPIWFEQYIGDQEPQPDPEAPFRIVIWQPLRERPTPPGWRATRALEQIHMTGFATPDWSKASYSENWSKHAKRHLKHWRQQTTWDVVEPTVEEFVAAYKKAPQGRLLKFLFIRMLRQMSKTQKGLVHLRAVRRKGLPNGPLEAGFAFVDAPEARQSKHFISFMWPTVKKEPVNVGLIDVWFQHARTRRYRFLDFGVFWTEEDPASWKGFSRFKGQFDITYVRYPLPRIRFVGSLRKIFRVY